MKIPKKGKGNKRKRTQKSTEARDRRRVRVTEEEEGSGAEREEIGLRLSRATRVRAEHEGGEKRVKKAPRLPGARAGWDSGDSEVPERPEVGLRSPASGKTARKGGAGAAP